MSALIFSSPDRNDIFTKTKLNVLSSKNNRPSIVPLVLLTVMVLALGLAGIIVLRTNIQEQSRALTALNSDITQLSYKEASLAAEVDRLRSPGHVAQEALKLGMVPSSKNAFILLPSGKIVGDTTPIKGNELAGVMKGGNEVLPKLNESKSNRSSVAATGLDRGN